MQHAHDLHSRGHVVQFYDDDRYLTAAIAEFARQGLSHGDSVVFLCTETHWLQVRRELGPASKKILRFNADESLKMVLDENGQPDQARFNSLIGEIHSRLRCCKHQIRFFGELVDLLCAQGRVNAALTLERFWNEFLQSHEDCILLCGYSTHNLPDEESKAAVRRLHSEMIPSEQIEDLRDENALYRRIALQSLTIAAQAIQGQDQKGEIEALKSELAKMVKLSSIGEMSAGLVHEINGPLSTLKMTFDQLRGLIHLPPCDETNRRLEIIDRSLERMNQIVRNVLVFARQEPLHQETTSLSASIRSAVELAQDSLANVQITLKVELPDEELHCLGDGCKLSQVFSNLITNARDAILATRRTDGLIEIFARITGEDSIEVTVTDNGCGMDTRTQEKMFLPFFTTKEAGKGTGLGLAISLATIREHQGQLQCSSAPGKGSQFKITLPLLPSCGEPPI